MTESNDYGELKDGDNYEDNERTSHPMPNTAEFHESAPNYGLTKGEAAEAYNALDDHETQNSNHSAEGMLGTVDIDSLLEETTMLLDQGYDITEAAKDAYDCAETSDPNLDEEGEQVDIDDLI